MAVIICLEDCPLSWDTTCFILLLNAGEIFLRSTGRFWFPITLEVIEEIKNHSFTGMSLRCDGTLRQTLLTQFAYLTTFDFGQFASSRQSNNLVHQSNWINNIKRKTYPTFTLPNKWAFNKGIMYLSIRIYFLIEILKWSYTIDQQCIFSWFEGYLYWFQF